MNQLQQGRIDMANRCKEIALINTPPTVTFVKFRKSLSGRAGIKGTRTEGTIQVPKPFTRKALYIFLHECAHMTLHYQSHKPRHVEEMEAEQWAHLKMREAGIPVPRAMTKRAKEYVAYKIHQAERRGAKHIDPRARKFSK